MDSLDDLPQLPWKAFGPELVNLVEATANKLDREWPEKYKDLGGAAALFELLARTVHNTFRTILVLSSDEPKWPIREEYALSVGPLARTILDTLCTVIYLLDDVPTRSSQFYKGGWHENHDEYSRHLERYGSDSGWQEWLTGYKEFLDRSASLYGVTKAEQADPKQLPYWPIPSQMLKDQTLASDRRDRLRYLYDWFYKQLSSQSHGSLPGLVMRAAALLPRQDADDRAEKLAKQRSDQVLVASLICLAFVSEIEIHFEFSLRARIRYVWRILVEHFDMARELYEPWYQKRLRDAEEE